MRRGFAVLACLCVLTGCAYFAVSKWGIRHETLNLYDNARPCGPRGALGL
jgi:hypothetical protein